MVYQDDFDSLGEFLSAVVQERHGGADPRLRWASTGDLEEGIPSRGGFLVPIDHAAELHERLYSTGALLGRCSQWPVAGENLLIPLIDERSRADGSRFGGVKMSWTLPGDAIAESKPKFARRAVNRRKLSGLVHVTSELMEDVLQLAAMFERLYSLEGAFMIEDEIINGAGTRGPLGILNSGALITVAKDSGQAAATVTESNVTGMMGRLWGASRKRAVWLTSNDVMTQLETLSQGGDALVDYDDNSGLPTMLGRPVLQTEYTAALGTLGDVILADLSEYLIGDPRELDVRFSGDTKFTTDEGAFRVRMRVDGMPAWNTPLVPKNSSMTQSPFVTLETRA